MTADLAQFAVTVASDDLELVHASKNGDVVAFEQLVKRYDRKLFRIAHSVTHISGTVLISVELCGYRKVRTSQYRHWLVRTSKNLGARPLLARGTMKEVSPHHAEI